MRPNKLIKYLLLISLLSLVNACGGNSAGYTQIPSANYNDRIRYLVIHHTAIDYADSLAALTEPKRVSAHYLIPEKGDPSYTKNSLEIQQLVNEQNRAWHAGVSYWQGKSGLNDQSIGIELVHQAPCLIDKEQQTPNLLLNSHALENSICFYPDYDEQQIQLLIGLAKDILSRYPEITPTRVIGHADLAPSRRVDPGPRFPWYRLYKEGIGAWYEIDTLEKYFHKFSQKPISLALLQRALAIYGYEILETGILDSQTINVLTVFQMHFRPWEVTGRSEPRTAATLFALIERYMPKRLAGLLQRHELEYQASSVATVKELSGQLNQKLQSTKNEAVSFAATFKGMNGQGQLSLISDKSIQVDLEINQKLIKTGLQLEPGETIVIDISHSTQSGTNYIKLNNSSNPDATIISHIPYPIVETNSVNKTTDFSKVDQLINNDIAKGFPGAVLAVVKNGQLIKHQAYGYAQRYLATGENMTSAETMTTNTLFDLASNTKMFATNYALMKLASEGLLDTNKAIQYYIPEYRGGGREQRLVKDLLNHTAGYEPSTAFYDANATAARGLFSQNPERTRQLLIHQVPFQMARNVKTVYSDNDYLLLGILVERISGMPLDEYVEQTIYQPLGLKHTLFNPLQKGFDRAQAAATELAGNNRSGRVDFENIRTAVIRGQVHDEKAFYSMAGVAGHAGLFSTAKEIATLATVILNRGGYGDVQLFSASVMDQFLKPSDKDITTGLGWRRAANGERQWQFGPYASPYAIGHTGWTGTVTVIDPIHDLVIVLLTNKKHSPIIETNGDIKFKGDDFETGKYGSVISLVYEAVLKH